MTSVSARFPCYVLKGPLKRDILENFLSTFFRGRKFKNTSAMRVIVFLKMFKIESKFTKCKKKKKKKQKLFLSKIIGSENVAINILY